MTNKFELLEDVVQKWRSETVLEMRNPISNKEVASVMDKTDMSSTLSVENGRKFSMSRRKRLVLISFGYNNFIFLKK